METQDFIELNQSVRIIAFLNRIPCLQNSINNWNLSLSISVGFYGLFNI